MITVLTSFYLFLFSDHRWISPTDQAILFPMSEDYNYKDWQISTLMLAYDLKQPIARDDIEALTKRQQDVEEELWQLVESTLPKEFLDNPSMDFPPEMVALLTKATLSRAARIAGLFPDQI